MIAGLPAIALDTETYPNFTEIGTRDVTTGAVTAFSTEPGIGRPLRDFREWFRERQNYLWITFNGQAYDLHMLRTIYNGCHDPLKLYRLSTTTINNAKDWRNRLDSVDGEVSVDLLAMCGGKNAKIGSLKEIGVKLGHPRLRELPYRFDQVLTHEQMVEVAEYNINDLEITCLAAKTLEKAIMHRIALSVKFGVNVINRHDAAVASTIMRHRLFEDQA